MEREAEARQEPAETARKKLEAAARFRQWWKDGEAKLKSCQESSEAAEKKAA